MYDVSTVYGVRRTTILYLKYLSTYHKNINKASYA